jgi:hypothetical protein
VGRNEILQLRQEAFSGFPHPAIVRAVFLLENHEIALQAVDVAPARGGIEGLMREVPKQVVKMGGSGEPIPYGFG